MPRKSLVPLLNSVRVRLFLLVFLFVIPAFAVQVLGAWNDLRQQIEERKTESQLITTYAENAFLNLLTESRSVFSDLIRVNNLRSATNCTQIFTELRFAFERLAPEATNLGLADAQGNIYCAIKPVTDSTNISNQPDFIKAANSLDLAVGEYQANPSRGSPLIRVSYPVLSFDEKLQTVIFAIYDVGWLKSWQKEVIMPPDTAITLFAPDGTTLWRTVNGEEASIAGFGLLDTSWVANLIGGNIVVEGFDFDGVNRLHSLTSLKNTSFLHFGFSVHELYEKNYQGLWWKLALLATVALLTMGVAYWGSKTMFLQPLAALLGVVKRVEKGDLNARVVNVKGLGELNELAQSFDRMTGSLQRREKEQRQLEERFRAAFENSAIGMGLLSLDGQILAANVAVCEMSGYTEDELKQRNDSQNVYPPDAQVGMDLFAEMLAGKRNFYSVERRYFHKNGHVFWTRLTLSLVRDENNQPAYLIGLIEDIGEQKRKSEALIESENRFKAMYDNTAVGMAMMTIDRKIISINQASAQMTGYSFEELLNSDPSFLSHPEDAKIGLDQFKEMISGNIPGYQMVKRYIRKDGSYFWGRVTYSTVPGSNGKPEYVVGMIEDITEQKTSAERLKAQEAEYRQLLETRIAERTQELNLANERLREKAAQDAVLAERTRLARDLHDAVTQTLFSTTLIADVLPEIWAMNIEEGKRRLEEVRQLTRGALAEMRTLLVELRPNALVEVPLPTLLRQLTEAMAGRSRLNIQFTAEGERKLPSDVQVGLYRIAQEAMNNIFKHAKAQQAMVNLRLGETVRLTIADNGTGFDPGTVTSDHLGLKIMRERAEAIGAKFNVYSEPDEGTHISIIWQEQQEQK